MTGDRFPMGRFLLHSLWVVLPFCALLVWTWNAWRSDADTRRGRVLEEAHRSAERALDGIAGDLGQWVSVPEAARTVAPPLPNEDPAARAARARYDADDFEAVLGSPESARSAAGLSLRSLAALQLLRKETDPARLSELAGLLSGSLDFMSPVFLEEAEHRFADLKLTPPPGLSGWRERWRRLEMETALARRLDDSTRASWMEHDGCLYLIETTRDSRKWRVRGESEVAATATRALARESRGLADGLALCVVVAGKSLVGPAGKSVLSSANRDAWTCDVVLADESAYRRGDVRTRNFMAGVISVAGLAVLFGMILAGRSYLRAVELARRQSEFMAAVSHEMRTPLAAMRLLAENLESGVADRAGLREEHTRMIREECARLGGLVDNVLAFTRGQRPVAHEAFDVVSLVEDVASFLRPLADRREISFEADVADFPEPPHGDVAALRRTLLNLLDNALKHTPEKGSIRCLVHPAGADEWRVEISDTGPGVPVGERARIFEPFYRIGDELRRSTPGTGLGLALVLRTVEAHGGRIEVGDAPGGGSCFTLFLPLHPPVSKP